jgi:hypothetical protein
LSALERARYDLGGHLGQYARRLRQAETDEDLYRTLAEALTPLTRCTAVLRIEDDSVRVHSASGAGDPIPLASAPAIASVAETLDCIVAIHGPDELSAALTDLLPAPAGSRVVLVPVVSRGVVRAVLYAENGPEPAGGGTLEALATIAGLMLEARTAEPQPPADLIAVLPATPTNRS